MTISFATDHILEIAIQGERQGAAFYERLAATAQNERVREECQRLVEFERQHEKTFRHLLGQRDIQQALSSLQAGQLSDEYHQYLSALVESNMLPDERSHVYQLNELKAYLQN